ncbi:mitochondrial transcription factor B1 isoform X2 [Augochlora pura]
MATGLRLPPLPTIRDMIKLYRVSAMKKLSQNFILNERLTDKMIRKVGKLADGYVLEVGPGPGALTRSILRQQPKELIVVEKDRRFQPILDMLIDSYAAVNATNWEETSPKLYIVGNLPFNVSTPLIIKWLQAISERKGPWALGRTRMTLTFQKEVAERIVAEPADKQRCRLSVMAQAWTRPVLHFIIPGSAFLPKPDVDVGLVTFVPLANPRTKHEFKIFEKVTRHIFSFRQKYSIRGIETLFPLDCREELGLMMYKLTDIDPRKRPMFLTVEDVDKLVSAYKYLMEKHPEVGLYEYRASRKVAFNKIKSVTVEECTDL